MPPTRLVTRNSNMQKSLAESDRAITILSPEPRPGSGAIRHADTSVAPHDRRRQASGRVSKAASRDAAQAAASRPTSSSPEEFYRDLVWNLRNGVLAVTRDGRIAVMNDVAYRHPRACRPRTTDIGRPFVEVLKDQPDVCADPRPAPSTCRICRTAPSCG